MTDSRKVAAEVQVRVKNASQELSDNLEAARARIIELHGLRDEVAEACVSKDIALARVDTFVAGLVNSARSSLYSASPSTFISAQGRAGPFGGDLTDVLMAYLGDQVVKAIKADVAALYKTTDGLDDGTREARLASIDRDIMEAELEEEGIIRSAEQFGFVIPRRADADPRAVLAADEVFQ